MAPDDMIKTSIKMHMCPLLGRWHEAEPPILLSKKTSIPLDSKYVETV